MRDEFFHSSETIRRETGIKKYALSTIVKRFIALGIFSINIKGMPRVKFFALNYDRIVELLPQIYLLEESQARNVDLKKLLLDFLEPIALENEVRRIARKTYVKM